MSRTCICVNPLCSEHSTPSIIYSDITKCRMCGDDLEDVRRKELRDQLSGKTTVEKRDITIGDESERMLEETLDEINRHYAEDNNIPGYQLDEESLEIPLLEHSSIESIPTKELNSYHFSLQLLELDHSLSVTIEKLYVFGVEDFSVEVDNQANVVLKFFREGKTLEEVVTETKNKIVAANVCEHVQYIGDDL